MINNNETKLKSHLEIIQANKRKKREFPSLSLDDKTLYDIYENGLAAVNNTFSSKNRINFQRNFDNVRNCKLLRDNSQETRLFPKQQQPKFDDFLKNETQKNIFQQNIYVNHINITNNFNNLPLNDSNSYNVNKSSSLISDCKENHFFTATQKKFEFEGLTGLNVNLPSFNDISNFTYSENPSNKRTKKGFENINNNTKSINNSSSIYNNTNNPTNSNTSHCSFLKSEILNVNLNSHNKNFINSSENIIDDSNINNINNNNFSDNFNVANKNFITSEIRYSLNLSTLDKKSFSPMRNAGSVTQNRFVSRNKLFGESGGGNLKDISSRIGEKFNEFQDENDNNKTQFSSNSNAVYLEYSNKEAKNHSNTSTSNIYNNNFSNSNTIINYRNNNNDLNNRIIINNRSSTTNSNNYNNTSPFSLANEATTTNNESNRNSGITVSPVVSGSDKASSASCFSNSSCNKINLKLIPNSKKMNSANIPSNKDYNNSHPFCNNYHRDEDFK